MKKIYLSLFAVAIVKLSTAQTLTKAANEPVIGDVETKIGYDSVSVVPKSTGTGQSWNFSSFTQNATTTGSTYSTTGSAPNASVFAGATMAEAQTGGGYNFWKSASTPSTQLELLGMYDPQGGGINYSYTNSAVYAIWPVAYGYSLTDTYSGPVSGIAGGVLNGTMTANASGTGTLTLPGGVQLTNILQYKVNNSVEVDLTTPAAMTITATGTDYYYYHSSQKFPIVTVSYQAATGTPSTAVIQINNGVVTGLNEKNFDATFRIFPNPAKDAFNVKLSNFNKDHGSLEIYNNIGQLVKNIDLGRDIEIEARISLQGLNSGIYSVKTSLGDRTSVRKLIID